MTASFGALILAAGKGTRMKSPRPKVLHTLLGQTMIGHVIAALSPLFAERIWTVVGHEAERVRAHCAGLCAFVDQPEQRGTGHALMLALPALRAAGIRTIVLINGDTPLVHERTLSTFIEQAHGVHVAFATLTLDDPAAFGRVLRCDGNVTAIVEAKEYDAAIHGPEPHEINAGLYLLDLDAVAPLLDQLTTANNSGEYYVTDLVGLAVAAGLRVSGVNCGKDPSLLGINSPAELAASEEVLRARVVDALLDAGVIMHGPALMRIAPSAVVEPGAELTGPCEIYGSSYIAAGARIDSHCVIRNSRVEAGAVISSFSHLEAAVVGPEGTVGPFARLRPGAQLDERAHVGNFVEMKKTRLGAGAKAGHLTYLGDADVGAGANIGAGTITCNYDGTHKHQTSIGAGAFIGSNTALVAPVRVGEHAVTGAGSAISKDIPDGHLGITRAPQKNLRWEKT